ncbi:MAG: hypothetical protein NTW16_11775, partial [Bacteroidetes bacterium]|nr:hypothetical protein [Bacteroidota bacterium]
IAKTGTIAASIGFTTVTGTGTLFSAELAAGDLLFNNSNPPVFIGIVKSIETSTSLTLTNCSAIAVNSAYKSNAVAGTGTSFLTELAVGDRLFKTDNTYIGVVTAIRSDTRLTVNFGNNFTGSDVNKVLICNGVTLGVVATVNSPSVVTLKQKAGAAVSNTAYKTADGTMTFATFMSGSSTTVYVTTWYDQSGNHRDIFQPKIDNQPKIAVNGALLVKNSKPSIEFDKSYSSFLQTSSAASWLTGTLYSQNIVSAEVTPVTTYQFVLSTTGGSGPVNTIMHYGYRSSTQYTVAQYGNDQNFEIYATNTLELHTAVKNTTSSSQMYFNGTFLGTASGGTAYMSDLGLLNIGLYTPTSNYYNGSVSELTVYAVAMGSADVAAMNSNQLAYYGISTVNWTGATNSDWATASNWSNDTVPTETRPSLVVIPIVTNKPVISGSTIAKAVSMQVQASSSLTVNGTLQLYGTLTTTNRNCDATNGTIEYKSNAGQSLLANTFLNNTVKNLHINTTNAAWVGLGGLLTVTGDLQFSGGKLNLGTSSVLTLSGTVTNTVSGGIRGNSNASIVVSGTPTLSFDQTTSGATNILKSLTINSAGTVTLANNLVLNNNGILTFTSGKLAIGAGASATTLNIRGAVTNTVSGGLTGGSLSNLTIDGNLSPTLSIDQTTLGTTNVFNNFSVSTTTGQTTTVTGNNATGVLVVNGTLTTAAGETLNMGTYAIGGTLATVSNSGTILTQSTSSTPLPSGKTWGGTVTYNAATAAQTAASGTFLNLTLSGSGTKTAGGNLVVNGILNNAGLLDMTSAYTLSGTLVTITNTGTIKTAVPTSTSILPIPSGKTWGGTIEYAGSSAQTAVTGTYNNLTISGTGGATSTTDLAVDGILNLSATNPSTTKGCLDMLNGATIKTLTMGTSATTIGSGDVTGIVKRTSFIANTEYSFGNQFTSMTFQATGTLPSEISFKIGIGSAPSWKTGAVMRTYDIIRSGTPTGTVTLSLHYLDGEMNGNTESNLVIWDYHLQALKAEEHGKANQSTTDNWIAISNRNVTYFGTSFDAHPWGLSNKQSANFTWQGTPSSDWSDKNNWSGGVVPTDTSDVVIPDNLTTLHDPILPAAAEIYRLTIQNGGILNGGSTTTLTINGAKEGSGAWLNEGGVFNPGTSQVIFTGTAATISGTNNFYDLTIAAGKALTPESGSVTRIAGTLTNSGTLRAALLSNTIEYNGAAQAVINPNGSTPGYDKLILSGSGTKTMPGTTLSVSGDFTMAGSAAATAAAALSVGGNVTIGTGAPVRH